MAKHDVEIRRYLLWRRKVRGKPISIRLYEIIYVGLTMLWSKMEKPPLKNAIYQFIERKEYEEELMSGRLFRKLIEEIKENPSEDETGYYLSDSREELTHKDIEQIEKQKDSVIKELSTNNLIERYKTVYRLCKLYQSWALKKKSQQAEDITKQESFEIYPYLPLNL
jgi:predicted DNA binding protein|tara:strand:- start:881 stop:1381 length:501 start_codon:yes stop_codon:yes gene_type:complete